MPFSRSDAGNAGILFVYPLFLALIWGAVFTDNAYIPLHIAQRLAHGQGLTAFVSPPSLLTLSPLWLIILTVVAWLGVSLPMFALIAGTLGWSFTALLSYQQLRSNQLTPVVAFVPVGLLIGGLVVILTLGTVWGWGGGLVLLAGMFTTRQQQQGKLVTYLLLFLFHPLMLIWLIILWFWKKQRHLFTFPSFGQMQLKQYTGFLLPLCGLLFFLQGQWVWQQYPLRPIAYHALESEVAQWLQAHSQQDDALLGTVYLGFLANHPVRQWSGIAEEGELPALWQEIQTQPPTFIVSSRTTAWLHLTQTGWFQTYYQPIQDFANGVEALSPLTIWHYYPTSLEEVPWQPATITVENGLTLVSYRYAPMVVTSGEAIYVELNWQTTHPITQTLNSVVRVQSPNDSVGWAQQDAYTLRSVPAHWLETGDTFREQFVLTTTTEMPLGNYHLNLSLYSPR